MITFKVIDLAKDLKVKPKMVIKHLKVKLGDKVSQGDLIAFKKGILGKKKEVLSPVDGILERLEEATGRLAIKIKSAASDIKKDVKSVKSKALKKDKKPSGSKKAKHQFQGVFGFGYGEGKLLYLKDSLDLGDLKEKYQDNVIACLEIKGKGVIFKAAALGIKGLVVGLGDKDMSTDVAECVEDFEFGFLVLSYDSKLDYTKEFKGKNVICNGDDKELIVL